MQSAHFYNYPFLNYSELATDGITLSFVEFAFSDLEDLVRKHGFELSINPSTVHINYKRRCMASLIAEELVDTSEAEFAVVEQYMQKHDLTKEDLISDIETHLHSVGYTTTIAEVIGYFLDNYNVQNDVDQQADRDHDAAKGN